MSKRRARVPDFASKKPAAKVPPAAGGSKAAPPPHTPPPAIKPQATSQKSGRRGA